MYSIGEFARLGGVSIRMLRHYDELGLLRPAATDPSTGYRRYTAGQLRRLNRILALKELGFTLKQVEQLLGDVDADELRTMLSRRRSQLEKELEDQRRRFVSTEARLHAIEKEDQMADDVVIRTLPETRVAAVSRPAAGFGPDNLAGLLLDALSELRAALTEAGISATGPPFAFYTGSPDNCDLIAFSALPIGEDVSEVSEGVDVLVLPEVARAATVVRQGAGTWPRVYTDLAEWLEANGYEHVGAGRDVWLELDLDDPSRNVAEIQWPVRRPGEPVPDIVPRRAATAEVSSRL